MECPRCKVPLRQMVAEGVNVDVCDTCAGVWFGQGELQRFDEPFEAAGEVLLDLPYLSSPPLDRSAAYDCPTGDGAVLARHFFSVKREVEVDECPSCGGYWLDATELQRIRDEFPSEEARDQAAVELLDEMFGAEMLTARTESQEDLARARRIANIFRFITPSYYLPGKQDGGAF